MQLLRTILIILLAYYGFKILSKLFAPILLKFVAKKAEQKFSQQFGQQNQQEAKKAEGEVSIDKNVDTAGKNAKKVGEYVDFEEIE
jgi:hypothetical protein